MEWGCFVQGQPFQQLVEPSSWVQVACQPPVEQEVWVACLRQGQLVPVLDLVDLVVVAGSLVVLALLEGSHIRGKVQEEILVQGEETSQGAHHMALEESHLGQEDPHDPNCQADQEDRTEGIAAADRKGACLEARGLAAAVGGREEDLAVDVAESSGLEVEDEIRSVREN